MGGEGAQGQVSVTVAPPPFPQEESPSPLEPLFWPRASFALYEKHISAVDEGQFFGGGETRARDG